MKLLQIFASAAIASAGLVTPTMSFASVGSGSAFGPMSFDTAPVVGTADGSYQEARRGRGGDDDRRERRGDRDRSDRNDSRDDRSGGRSRPRVPGGSGCDSPGDMAEHAECGGGGTGATTRGTPSGGNGGHGGRPRIPGGSGCDDPRDLIEHPECRI